jgi:ribosomal-protein-alanine N-acetyltransferase
MQDDDEIFFLRSDETVNKFLVSPIAKSIQDARDFINKINAGMTNSETAYWAITIKGNNRLIGTICIWNIERQENKAEIGYVLHPDYSGNGFMHEAVAAVIQYGFRQMKLQYLDAVTHRENKRSIRLLERNGFTYKAASGDEVVFQLSNSIQDEQ